MRVKEGKLGRSSWRALSQIGCLVKILMSEFTLSQIPQLNLSSTSKVNKTKGIFILLLQT